MIKKSPTENISSRLTRKFSPTDYPRWSPGTALASRTSQQWCSLPTKCPPCCCTTATIILQAPDTTASPPRLLVSSQSHRSWPGRNRRSSVVPGWISADSMASDLDGLFYESAGSRFRSAVLSTGAKIVGEQKFSHYREINRRGFNSQKQSPQLNANEILRCERLGSRSELKSWAYLNLVRWYQGCRGQMRNIVGQVTLEIFKHQVEFQLVLAIGSSVDHV